MGGVHDRERVLDAGIVLEAAQAHLRRVHDKLAELDEATAGVLIPTATVIMKYAVDPESARGADCVYGIDISGQWGASGGHIWNCVTSNEQR